MQPFSPRLADLPAEIAVFPLTGALLLPRGRLPLNIFEPRYIKMVHDSIERGVPIALSLEDPTELDGVPIVVGYGSPQVLETRPDGSMVIVLKGAGRAELDEVVETEPYITCRAIRRPEFDEVSPENNAPLERLRRRLWRWADESIAEPEQRAAVVVGFSTPQRIIEALAMIMVRDTDLRQAILEMDDLNERIKLMKFLC